MICNTKVKGRWNIPSILCRSLILVAITAITSGWAAATETGEATVAYQAEGDLLTVQANNVSLRQILAQVSGSTGILVEMPPALDRPVTIIISKKPAAEAFKQLLRGDNYALAYEEHGKVRRLAKVTILPKGEQGGVEPVAPRVQSPSPSSARIYSEEERAELKRRLKLRESRSPAAKTHGPARKGVAGSTAAGVASAGKKEE